MGKSHEAFLAGRSAVFYKGLGGGIEEDWFGLFAEPSE